MTRSTIPALTLMVFAGCTSETGRDTVDAPPLELVEELRLDPNVEDFSVVNRLSVGPRGQIVVAQPQARQLRMYDSSGVRVGRAKARPICRSASRRSPGRRCRRSTRL